MRDGMRVDEHGNHRWYVNNRLHRTDGAAVVWRRGTREWWLNGQPHRTDGPAVERWDGTAEWWMDGERYSFQEWLEVNTEITPQQRTLLVLKYGDG